MITKRILIIAVIIILAWGWNVDISAYQPLGSPAAITSQGTVPITLGSLLDDFSKGTSVTCWGTTTSTTVKEGTTAAVNTSYPNTPSAVFGASGQSLMLTYDINASDSWAAYVVSLGNQSIADYKYLSFWVKGSTAGLYFKIELHHRDFYSGAVDATHPIGYNNNFKSEVYITDYLDGGVTTDWQKVVIPLDAFANITDRAVMKEMVIAFENSACGTNNSPKSGSLYIDNVSFGKQFPGFVRIDHYGDKVGKNALGGNCGHSSGAGPIYGSYSYSGTAGQYNAFPNGLVFNFASVFDPRYYCYSSIVGGGDSGNVLQPRNFGEYQKLSFSAKSSSSDITTLKLELHCPTYLNNYFHFFTKKNNQHPITTSWKRYTISLTEFTSDGWGSTGNSIISSGKIDSVGEIVFTRDGWVSKYGDWELGQYTGTFYIDQVQFEIDNYQPDTTAPVQPSTPTISVSGNKVTFTSSASSRFTDPSMEAVFFVYNNGAWRDAAYDYNTEDSTYSATWDVSGLPSGSYQVAAFAMDAANNRTWSGTTTFTK